MAKIPTTPLFPLARLALLLATGAATLACAQSNHPVEIVQNAGAPGKGSSPEGSSLSWGATLEKLREPGPVKFEKFVAADWAVDRSGMINLKHEKAKEAKLEDGPEAIQIYFYILEHPRHGTFMVDSGIARSVARREKGMPFKWPVSSVIPLDELKVHLDTQSYIESRKTPLDGVFLTHLHLDHILGLRDIPKDVPLYVGPGETLDRRFTHLLVRPTTNANLAGFGPLRQWKVSKQKGAPLATVDLFGDMSVLGLHIPGHTRGNMAFLVRTPEGPHLITGDGCHTEWGWENNVEPGTFNTDGEEAAHSLSALKKLEDLIPNLEIHLGHQPHSNSRLARLD
jgi:N-acyl homoserine lactone hydrolase